MFPADRVHVYLFEDLQRDGRGFMETLARDIGIDPAFYRDRRLAARNPSVSIRSPTIHRVVRGLAPVIPKTRLTRAVYDQYLRIQDSRTAERTPGIVRTALKS